MTRLVDVPLIQRHLLGIQVQAGRRTAANAAADATAAPSIGAAL
jgi:hypothetical protein